VASQVQPILVKLGIEGYEELAKLKSAFRGLDATVNQSDAVLEKARKAILDYGKQAQNSEATLKGLETALKGVREQAQLHSPLYTQLTQDLKEVGKAQRDYIADLNSTVSAYKKLEQVEQGAMRRAQKVASIQELATTANPLEVAGRRTTEFGAVPQAGRGPGGVFIAPPFRSTPYSPGTQYDRPIGPQPVSAQVKAAEQGVERAMQGINDAMERGLNERAKLQEKYRQHEYDKLLEGLDLEGQARKRAFDAELADFDRRLDIADRKRNSQRRITAQGVTQIAGAAISGGIFGGPEGFLGGVAGGALGGVGGAFAGAAIGAQVAMLRQAAGAAAEYAAAINQQRRALSGVVEDSAAYQQSLAFIDQTSRALAIPQEQVTRNFTKLSASVLGAGGDVAAAQEAFLGVSSAILGTGGTLADLDAALLATAQVFSKGKVSAEELRGQIGERLPGAFTLFAESIGKTPAELDKMLEKGQVTLNDFMKFVRLANTEYGKNVIAMSQSGEVAGRRLATAWGRTQEAIGKELQPLGAAFQTVFADFFEDNEGTIVAFVRGVVAGFNAIGDVIRGLGAYIAEMRRQFDDIVSAWTSRWTTFTSFFSSAFNGAGNIIFNRLGFLSTAFRAVADFIQNVFTQAFGAISDRWKATVRNIVNNSTPIGWVAQMLGLDPGKAVVAGLEGMASPPTPRPRQPNALPAPQSNVVFPAGLDAAAAEARKGKQGPKPPEDRTLQYQQELVYLKKLNEQELGREVLIRQGRDLEAARADMTRRQVEIEYERERALAAANYQSERDVIRAIADEKLRRSELQYMLDRQKIEKDTFDKRIEANKSVQDAAKPIRDALDARMRELSSTKEYARLIQEGVLPAEAKRLIAYKELVQSAIKQQDEELKLLEIKLEQLKASNLSADIAEGERKRIEEQIDLIKRKKEAIEGAAASGPGPAETDIDRINAGITAAQEKLNELTNVGNIVVTAANNIGNAFGEAFNKLVTGAGSARQVLSQFFQDVANGFFKMAQEIIAQTLIMITLQAILKALGGASTSGSTNTPNLSDVQSGADFKLGERITTSTRAAAKGDAFTPQGPVERYAKGGIVNAPTLFRYAKGGTFAPGLMGEAGPEAILPLRRTPDGRLGVTQVRSPQGGDRMREMLGRSPAQQQAPTLNLKFETTTINGVEYVSREQLEVAMAETRKRASKEGAERGMSMTLDKMRNSPRTRTQVGMR
jgi:tape measure domain-containing protein